MQFKHTFLRFTLLLAAAFSAFSCITVDKSMGEQYLPEEHELIVKTATFPLPVVSKMQDSLQGITNGYISVGAIRTAELGLAQFASSANVCPATLKLNFGKDPVIKYIYLSAKIDDFSAMEENQASIPQDFFVYRLKKHLDTTTAYTNSISMKDCQPTPLNVSSATFFGKDSVKIYLKNEYGTELLSATREELDSTDLFVQRFKGLYITCNNPDESLPGGRVNHFSYESAAVVMKYNFQPTWGENLSRKDTIVYLSFGDGFCLNTSEYHSASLATDQPQETLPVEGVAGIKPYIDAKALKATLDAWAAQNNYNPKNILIAKATFSLPFEIPANLDMSNYPSYLFPTYRSLPVNNLNRKYYYPFADVNSTGNGLGALNRSLSEYSGNLSSTVQKIINTDAEKLESNYNIWMSPIASQTDKYYGTVSYVSDLTYYYAGKINGPKATRYPTLTIVYSVLPE